MDEDSKYSYNTWNKLLILCYQVQTWRTKRNQMLKNIDQDIDMIWHILLSYSET